MDTEGEGFVVMCEPMCIACKLFFTKWVTILNMLEYFGLTWPLRFLQLGIGLLMKGNWLSVS